MPHSGAAAIPFLAAEPSIVARQGMSITAWLRRALHGIGVRRRAAAAPAAAAADVAVTEFVEGGLAIVALAGRLDAAGAADAESRLPALDGWAPGGCGGLVADMTGVR
jgi:anti-anti-sigma factor